MASWRVRAAFLAAFMMSADAWAQAPAFQPRDESEAAFPDNPGRTETFGLCGSCHGFSLVAAQGLTRAQWNDSINLMIQRHNMPVIEQDHRDQILDYLAKAFPPRAPAGARPGWRNPFMPQ